VYLVDNEFFEALEIVRKTTGYGAYRLARRFGLGPDMMKSLFSGRRRPGRYTAVSVYGGCIDWLEDRPPEPVQQALMLLMDAAEKLGE
jgi:hypothetical protein